MNRTERKVHAVRGSGSKCCHYLVLPGWFTESPAFPTAGTAGRILRRSGGGEQPAGSSVTVRRTSRNLIGSPRPSVSPIPLIELNSQSQAIGEPLGSRKPWNFSAG